MPIPLATELYTLPASNWNILNFYIELLDELIVFPFQYDN